MDMTYKDLHDTHAAVAAAMTGAEIMAASGGAATKLPNAPYAINYTAPDQAVPAGGGASATVNRDDLTRAQTAAGKNSAFQQAQQRRKLGQAPRTTLTRSAPVPNPQILEKAIQSYGLKGTRRAMQRLHLLAPKPSLAKGPQTPSVAPTRSIAISPESPVFQRRQRELANQRSARAGRAAHMGLRIATAIGGPVGHGAASIALAAAPMPGTGPAHRPSLSRKWAGIMADGPSL